MKKLPFKLLLLSFSLFCPGFCSNRGNLGRVPTRHRGSCCVKWTVGGTWLPVDLVRDLRAAEKRA